MKHPALLLVLIMSSGPLFAKDATQAEGRVRQEIGAAQRRKDLPAVERLSREYNTLLGDKAGVPEAETKFVAVPADAARMPSHELKHAFTPALEELQHDAWWTKHPDTADMPFPLRSISSVVEGCLAARRAGCENPENLLRVAREAADFLLWAQEQGGQGCFPFPAMRGKSGRTGELSELWLAKITKEKRLNEVMRNGWFIKDDGNGDLQFDNGLAGVAVLRCYEATHEQKYLQSARAAADWATAEPTVKNWNYNSFSVFLLAETFRVTGERKYLDAAKEKARLGIYPGQLTEGPDRGRWNDPHNARLVYHYILLRGLASLVSTLPENDADLPRAKEVLRAGLRTRNAEIVKNGVANTETVLDTLSRIHLAPGLTKIVADTDTQAAFDANVRFVSRQFLRRHTPIPPGAWGLMLEALAKAPHGK